MTLRQKALKYVYPLLIWAAGPGTRTGRKNANRVGPRQPFHALQVTLNNGSVLPFEQLRGKKVVLVNTASDCGYTPQYAELQSLTEATGERLVILGFPANDFKEQEKGTDAEIAGFCQLNYGVRFPLAQKSVVRKNPAQHPVFRWLTHQEQNGWNDNEPVWNFTKYVVNEAGVLTHVFAPAVSPLSKAFQDALR